MFSRVSLLKVENDSGTGERDLINDGVGPGSPLLLDHDISARTVAHVYTPGLEQRDGLTGALHLFGVDAIGSVRTLINDDGNQMVTDTQSFDAYGITRSRTGSDWMAFGFAGADGYQTDPNELMLLGNREYHPFTGRFLTRDPAHAGSNDYEYADDNPLSFTDPSGLEVTWDGRPPDFYGPDGGGYWDDGDGGVFGPAYDPSTDTSSGDSRPSSSGSDDSGYSSWSDTVGSGASVGLHAVFSSASFGLYNGGAARHDPSFATSKIFANIGVGAAIAAATGRASLASTSRVFWSGAGAQVAAQAGKGTAVMLEDTLLGKTLNGIESSSGKPLADWIWQSASALFAANASQATVYLNNPATNRIWSTVEGPILRWTNTPINEINLGE